MAYDARGPRACGHAASPRSMRALRAIFGFQRDRSRGNSVLVLGKAERSRFATFVGISRARSPCKAARFFRAIFDFPRHLPRGNDVPVPPGVTNALSRRLFKTSGRSGTPSRCLGFNFCTTQNCVCARRPATPLLFPSPPCRRSAAPSLSPRAALKRPSPSPSLSSPPLPSSSRCESERAAVAAASCRRRCCAREETLGREGSSLPAGEQRARSVSREGCCSSTSRRTRRGRASRAEGESSS
mgnify:CR=1 FL=1